MAQFRFQGPAQVAGANSITVYDSARKPIEVPIDGTIETADERLIANLSRDGRFAKVVELPKPVVVESATPQEKFVAVKLAKVAKPAKGDDASAA
jgi:hypothetical protein